MKRLLPVVCCVVAVGIGDLSATVVAGKVGFVTKRGQRPAVNETLVWLEPVATAKAPRIDPSPTQMTTRNKTLLPHVLAVPAGSTVSFPNEDPISHNLFSLSAAKSFDLGLYRRGAGKSQKFDSPGVVNVYCNVHPNMSAVIHVMPTPYYVFADNDGNYSIDVPPGRYRLLAWNEQGGATSTEIDVQNNRVNGNLALTIDSRNYRFVQHTNKLGKPYQAPSSREY
jgi:plastocyanin